MKEDDGSESEIRHAKEDGKTVGLRSYGGPGFSGRTRSHCGINPVCSLWLKERGLKIIEHS